MSENTVERSSPVVMTKGVDKGSSSWIPSYLLQVARKSRAGFDRIHEEVVRRVFGDPDDSPASDDSPDRNSTLTIRASPSRKVQRSGSFRSYIDTNVAGDFPASVKDDSPVKPRRVNRRAPRQISTVHEEQGSNKRSDTTDGANKVTRKPMPRPSVDEDDSQDKDTPPINRQTKCGQPLPQQITGGATEEPEPHYNILPNHPRKVMHHHRYSEKDTLGESFQREGPDVKDNEPHYDIVPKHPKEVTQYQAAQVIQSSDLQARGTGVERTEPQYDSVPSHPKQVIHKTVSPTWDYQQQASGEISEPHYDVVPKNPKKVVKHPTSNNNNGEGWKQQKEVLPSDNQQQNKKVDVNEPQYDTVPKNPRKVIQSPTAKKDIRKVNSKDNSCNRDNPGSRCISPLQPRKVVEQLPVSEDARVGESSEDSTAIYARIDGRDEQGDYMVFGPDGPMAQQEYLTYCSETPGQEQYIGYCPEGASEAQQYVTYCPEGTDEDDEYMAYDPTRQPPPCPPACQPGDTGPGYVNVPSSTSQTLSPNSNVSSRSYETAGEGDSMDDVDYQNAAAFRKQQNKTMHTEEDLYSIPRFLPKSYS